ncbi:MAG: PD40 domain-containing protein [Anaerolineales bacterium]|nr:PD40 domain-containing protein [Anaerolineales bacterium]
MNKRKVLIFLVGLIFILACNLPSAASSPTPDLFATLSAATPLSADSTAQVVVPVSPDGEPFGQIAFTCQVFKVTASNQICIINADGTGFRRLTVDNTKQHYYPSVAPDGKSVVYAAFREPNIYEIYEVDIASGVITQLTDRLGNLNGPEISPDGSTIVFKLSTANSNELWLMDRDGSNPRQIPNASGWDPTWSPDGSMILFASDMEGAIQLFRIRLDGSDLQKISSLPAIRGRSDWSPDGQFIVTYSGQPWNRDVYIMNADGSNAKMISPTGGNSQGPSFSPDGQWVAFTSYFDNYGDDHGCEIYIMRIDGSDPSTGSGQAPRRLTNNDYCDFQPRWGP